MDKVCVLPIPIRLQEVKERFSVSSMFQTNEQFLREKQMKYKVFVSGYPLQSVITEKSFKIHFNLIFRLFKCFGKNMPLNIFLILVIIHSTLFRGSEVKEV